MAEIRYPFGAAKTLVNAATGTQAHTIENGLTIIDGVTTEATGNLTLNLTIDTEVPAGAKINIKQKTNGTETFTFGTGITAPVVTGAAGKTWSQSFTYDGTTFHPDGAKIQID